MQQKPAVQNIRQDFIWLLHYKLWQLSNSTTYGFLCDLFDRSTDASAKSFKSELLVVFIDEN